LTAPVSARSKPRTCLISVVLPAPFSPTRPNTHPRETLSDTALNAVFEPNRRDRLVTVTTASLESRIRLPPFPPLSPRRKFGFQEPSDLIFAEIERFKLVQRGFNEGVRLLHQLFARHD